jgi:hypothetical protein
MKRWRSIGLKSGMSIDKLILPARDANHHLPIKDGITLPLKDGITHPRRVQFDTFRI